MPTVATTNIPIQKAITVTAVAVARGTRLTLNSNGLGAASAIGVRGEYVALQDIPASGIGLCAVTAAGGSVPMLAGEAGCDRGDVAYSMAAGATGVTSSSAVIMGKWLQTTASGALGVVELASVS